MLFCISILASPLVIKTLDIYESTTAVNDVHAPTKHGKSNGRRIPTERKPANDVLK
jgi:hypothetical protein